MTETDEERRLARVQVYYLIATHASAEGEFSPIMQQEYETLLGILGIKPGTEAEEMLWATTP